MKVTRLVRVPPAGESSSEAIAVKAETVEPVKTPRIVSKLLPAVEMVTEPELGAVQDHHTEAPPGRVPIDGSPVSLLAPTFEPVAVALEPLRTVALAKLLLAGPVCGGGAAA